MQLTITATNVSDVAITAALSLNPVSSRARVFYRRAGGEFSHLKDPAWGHGDVPWRTPEPGEQYSVQVILSVTGLSWDPTQFLCGQPGIYEFTMHYRDTTPFDPNGRS